MPKFTFFHDKDDMQTFAAGDVIFEQGAAGEYMYDVISGEVALFRDGRELVRLQHGEIFGETGLINNQAHSVTAKATTRTKVAKVSKRRFMFMVTETPHFALKVMGVLAERLNKETEKHAA